jgi:hypothetical protein
MKTAISDRLCSCSTAAVVLALWLCAASWAAAGPLEERVDGLAVGDVNNDGANELVVTNPLNKNLAVFDSSYRLLCSVSFNEEPYSVLIADLNGDSVNELAVGTSNGADPGFVYVGRILGDSEYVTTWTSPACFIRFGKELAAGDNNGNGRNELVVGMSWWDRMMVSYEYNDTTYVPVATKDIGSDVDNVCFAGDRLVVGTSCWSDYGLRVYERDTLVFSDLNDGYTGVAAGDVDGDDSLEIVRGIGTRGDGQSPPRPHIAVYDQDYSIVYESPELSQSHDVRVYAVAAGEVLPGGGEEIAVGTYSWEAPSYSEKVRLFQWTGTIYEEVWQEDLDSLGDDVYHIEIADLNRDGRNELYVGTTRGLRVYGNHDARVDTILVPQGIVPLDSAVAPRVVVCNHGFAADSFRVALRIGSTYADTAFVSLGPAEADTVTFALWHATQRGTFVVACSTMLDGDQYPRNDKKTGTVTVSSGGLEIYSITPNRIGSVGSATVEISGADFRHGCRVRLTKAGQPNVDVDTSWITMLDSSKINVTIPLDSVQLGNWDCVVTNPDSTTAIYYGGLTIEPRNLQLWIDVTGSPQIRGGRPTDYILRYGNRGNVDACDAVIWLSTPPDVDCRVAAPLVESLGGADTTRPHLQGDGIEVLQWIAINRIPALSDGRLVATLTSWRAGHTRFPLRMQISETIHWNAESLPILLVRQGKAGFSEVLSEHDVRRPSRLLRLDQPQPGEIVIVEPNSQASPCGHAGIIGTDGKVHDLIPDPNRKWPFGSQSRMRSMSWDDFVAQYPTGTNVGHYQPPGWDPNKGFVAAQHISDYESRQLEFWVGFDQSDFEFYGAGDCVSLVRVLCDLGGYRLLDPTRTYVSPGMLYGLCTNGKPFYRGKHFKPQVVGLLDAADRWLAQLAVSLIETITAGDPNDKAGPAGFDSLHFVPVDETFEYLVHFENVDTATAPAENIVVTDTLDSDLDWTTFAFDTSTHHPTSMVFDSTTGVVTWRFDSINLPPNHSPPEGEGWLSYTVNPKPDLPTGTEIRNRAWIVFDVNAPMATRQVLNTIDAGPPSSNVVSLPEDQPLSSFTVQLAGADDQGGSGIRSYDVHVSDNDSAYALWTTTESASVVFTGQNGHTYRFYSIAKDNVGYVEAAKTQPEAVTTISLPTGIEVSPNPFVPSRGHKVISFFGAGLSEAEIKVFNKAGELVKRLTGEKDKDRLDWDAKSDDGKTLASGVYIYVAREKSGTVRKGKFAIIR